MLTEGMFIADRYEVVQKIGAGGMSDVYKAKDHVLGRFVAIKVLKTEFSDDVNFVTKFRTEAQSAAGLEHPNIVNIYDVGSEDGMHFIVMEYVEGITLKTYIEKKGQLSYKEAISIAIQVGRGIEAAHNKHIVHRDIKPQNIIISTEGKVKVTDFGIARAATSNTINSDVMGSVHYASPEQARNGFVDGKSDIYSLGIVMYEMVTGRVPFDGDTTVAVAIQHLQEEMVTPSAYAPDLPISLEKIILKCTQKSADRRYQSMEDLLMDLKKSLISPDEDFVVMTNSNGQDKTRIIGDEELQEIREKTHRVPKTEKDILEDDEDEEDEDGIMNPKVEKAVTILGAVAGVLIIGILIFVLLSVADVFHFGGSSDKDTEPQVQTESQLETQTETQQANNDEMVTMISLENKTLEEAKTAVAEMGIQVEQESITSSDTIEEGRIISQSAETGKQIPKGTIVTVVISSGAGNVSIPDVSNYSLDEATKSLEDAGFDTATDYADYESSANVEKDHVVYTTPAAGSQAKPGDTVTIVLSRGIESVKVPDVRKKSKDEAIAELEAAGLTATISTSENNESIEADHIIEQSITPGTYVNRGDSIKLTVSLGAKTVYYSYSTTIDVPQDDLDYVSVTITLMDDKETVLRTWKKVKVSTLPQLLNYTDIENSSNGVLKLVWSYRDENGETLTKEDTQKVNFTEQ